MISKRIALCALVGGLATASVFAGSPLDSVSLVPVATGLNRPLLLTHAGDGSGRRFIVEQSGRIKVMVGDTVQPTPFLNVGASGLNLTSGGTTAGSEQGLLGLAFHPSLNESPYAYIYYTMPGNDSVIARYTISAGDPNVADPASGMIIMGPIDEPQTNHNGGHLAFGPDGYLYLGLGDGGGGNDDDAGHTAGIGNGQDTTKVLGKMLRIDVNGGTPYAIPPDNPFFGSSTNAQEIYAWGLRNPWRYSFDLDSGRLFCGDVGQDTREEIDIIELGGNYGWRCFEGNVPPNPPPADTSHCLSINAYDAPIAVYAHSSGSSRCAVTGGYVYRGRHSPDLYGYYFYGDYCTGEIFALDETTPGTFVSAPVTTASGRLTSFGEDESGEVYACILLNASSGDGTIYRLETPFIPPASDAVKFD